MRRGICSGSLSWASTRDGERMKAAKSELPELTKYTLPAHSTARCLGLDALAASWRTLPCLQPTGHIMRTAALALARRPPSDSAIPPSCTAGARLASTSASLCARRTTSYCLESSDIPSARASESCGPARQVLTYAGGASLPLDAPTARAWPVQCLTDRSASLAALSTSTK